MLSEKADGKMAKWRKEAPQRKSDMMRALRERRKSEGLVEFRAWVTSEQKEYLQSYLHSMDK